MKKLVYLLMFAVSVSFLLTNCKSTKSVESGSKELSLPFEGKEFKSDKEYYRAKANAKSPDLSTAKKAALNNAKAEIAGLINTKIKTVTDNYTNQRSTADAQDFENKFETMTREIVNQQLSDVQIMDEKAWEKGKAYDYWVVIQVSKQAILDGINNTVSKNQKLQIDYDKKKFEEVYNAEMEKMEEGK
jgi:hypothetical protein